MKIKIILGITALVAIIASCESNESLDFDRYYSTGSIVYQNHCQNCHGAHGEGLKALIPPLTDSAFLKKNLQLLPCLVKNGLKGKITIHQKEFDSQMPADTGLANIEIAQALTYITNSNGNKLGIFNVQMVTGDLQGCR